MTLAPHELDELREARGLLEAPSLAARLTDLLGRPIEKGIELLPAGAATTIQTVVRVALQRGLDVALATMGRSPGKGSADRLHRLASATAGAVGGFFGLAGVTVELPVTTTIMLRSIGDIARSEGHDLADPATRVACLEVFALGGPSHSDDAVETGYYAVRGTLATLVNDAVRHIAQRGLSYRGAPVLVRLLERIATRFGIVVQEKVALELFPAIGAVSGALVNSVFMGHFQNLARGHFIVRRLERQHGEQAVRDAWNQIAADEAADRSRSS